MVIGDVTPNPAFDSDLLDRSVADTEAAVRAGTELGSPAVMLDAGRVYLGTAWFTGDSAASGMFSIELYDGFGANVLTRAGRSLDMDPGDDSFVPLTGGATFSVVVPEPASLLIVSAAIAAGSLRRARPDLR